MQSGELTIANGKTSIIDAIKQYGGRIKFDIDSTAFILSIEVLKSKIIKSI
jgi:hypothetical protein